MRIEDPTKRALREEIAQLTEDYIARGGKIKVLPMRCVSPPSKAWIADNGGCYTPWGWVFGEYEQPQYSIFFSLGDGGYWKPAARVER